MAWSFACPRRRLKSTDLDAVAVPSWVLSNVFSFTSQRPKSSFFFFFCKIRFARSLPSYLRRACVACVFFSATGEVGIVSQLSLARDRVENGSTTRKKETKNCRWGFWLSSLSTEICFLYLWFLRNSNIDFCLWSCLLQDRKDISGANFLQKGRRARSAMPHESGQSGKSTWRRYSQGYTGFGWLFIGSTNDQDDKSKSAFRCLPGYRSMVKQLWAAWQGESGCHSCLPSSSNTVEVPCEGRRICTIQVLAHACAEQFYQTVLFRANKTDNKGTGLSRIIMLCTALYF